MVRTGTALLLGLLFSCAAVTAQESQRYTRRELHKLMREADTPDKREKVSAYCDRIAKDLRALAKAELTVGSADGSQIRAGSSKYPNGNDRARSLSQHYGIEANRMQKLADEYCVESNAGRAADVKKKADPAYTDVEQQLLKRIDGLEEQLRSLKNQPSNAAPNS